MALVIAAVYVAVSSLTFSVLAAWLQPDAQAPHALAPLLAGLVGLVAASLAGGAAYLVAAWVLRVDAVRVSAGTVLARLRRT
jgi:hypothetical protein